MNITYIVPGSGGSFYCGNCLRDSSFISSLKQTGHQTSVIPMYLPLTSENIACKTDTPIFYGAVKLYLKQLNPVFKHLPKWLDKYLDSMPVLRFAAKRAGSTRASGLDKMTISMLKGEHGNQAEELDILVDWLKHHEKPDLVHISNALLSGLAPKIKNELQCAVVCSLQDEDEWIDELDTETQKKVWDLILENAASIDAFVSVSEYYKQYILSRVNIPEQKIKVIYNGINTDQILANGKEKKSPVIGYLARINKLHGLDLLIDVFARLKKENANTQLKLKITGGYTGDDLPFIKDVKAKIKREKLDNDIEFIEHFDDNSRRKFFENITIFTVPSVRREAFGIQVLESLVAGVPVVLPNHGAYSEIVNKTDSGILYNAENKEAYYNSLKEIINNKELYGKFHRNCFTGLEEHFNLRTQTYRTIDLYESLIKSNSTKLSNFDLL